MNDLIDKMEKTITEHALLGRRDCVLIALSGGPDSVALLHLLDLLKVKYRIKLAAAHLDHSLRPNSAKDRKFCRRLCRNMRIRFHSRRVNVRSLAERERLSLEGGGRKARYAYLESLATKYGYDKIATGHTLDDNIETIIFNLARGSGLTGLAGIPVKRGKIIRPLIRINKDELITWLHRQDIPFVKDPTNKSLRFARNRIRLKIVPELQRLNSAAKENIARSSSNAAEEVEFISDMAVSAYGDAMLKAGKSKIVLDLKKLREYDTGLMKKVVQEAFRKLNRSENRLSSNSFSRILGVINGRSGAKSPVGDGVFIEQSQGQVSLFRVISRTTGMELRLPGITEMAGSNCRLETQVAARNRIKNLNAGSDIAYLDIRKMKDIRVRFWKNGDRIKPLGMNGHKLISDILIDRKVPEFERRHIPLVMSGNKVAWIAGVMISEEFKVGPETKKVLKLRLCAQS